MADIRFVAKSLIDAGWAVVPLVKGQKRAGTSWQNKTYAPNDFGPYDGVAGKCGAPSGWRVDVDCDSMEAVEAAKLLLPPTGLVHGRPGKPDSHYWYIVDGAKTTQFTDVPDASGAKSMLVEVRSTGGYTALPPSYHPSGDQLTWSVERPPTVATPDELYGHVRNVALAALLAKHWPGSGARHHMVGHLAGFLCQAGLDAFVVIQLIETAATLAHDPDVGDRKAFAVTTVAKHKAGESVTGGPKLAEVLGDAVVGKMRQWLRLAQDADAVEKFNQVHFWTRLGKDDVIGREDDPDGVVFQKPRSLYTEYANQLVKVGATKKGEDKHASVFEAWLKSTNRRSYKRVVFSPPPAVAGPDDYNLWQGYAVEPKPGDCSKFLEHLRLIVCSGNEEHYAYLMNWLAQLVQAPGKPTGTAVVMRGREGTGKGVFARTIGELFGRRHYTQLDKVDQLAGHFNAALSSKIVVFADEAFWAGDKREVGALKRLISEPTLHIVRKGIDGVDEANHVHLFMATNDEWSWPAGLDDRRGFLLKVADDKMSDRDYFRAIMEELKHGGKEALLDHLLKFPVDPHALVRPPKTVERRVQQVQSLPNYLEWWYDCLDLGSIGQLGWPAVFVPGPSLFAAYVGWHQGKKGRALSRVEFGRRLGPFFSDRKTYVKKAGNGCVRGFDLRPLTEARDYFDKEVGILGDWDDAPASSGPDVF